MGEDVKMAQVAFNGVALFLACVFLVTTIFMLSYMLPKIPVEMRNIWHFCICYEVIVLTLLGGGAISNFTIGRTAGLPTTLVVAGCFMSVCLIPMGVWGIILLFAHDKKSGTSAQ